MTLRGVEKDIEQAVAARITTTLATDGITARVGTFTGGMLGEENSKTAVLVTCAPLEYGGAGVTYWIGSLEIVCETSHLTPNDRDGTDLADLVESIAFMLDQSYDYSTELNVLGSLSLRRVGGEHDISDSTNMTLISVDIIRACG